MQPVEKYPSFLSPSSRAQFRAMPLTFYLSRMAPDPIKNFTDSYATSLGTAIDAAIKLNICKEFDWESIVRFRILNDIFNMDSRSASDKLSLKELLINPIPEQFADARELGLKVGEWYCKTPMYNSLDFVDIEYHPKFDITNGQPDGCVPIYCKLDCEVRIPLPNGMKACVPLDIKSTQSSPTAGYMMLYDQTIKDCLGNIVYKKHKNFVEGMSFDSIDESWGAQLLTYHMALKYKYSQCAVNVRLIPNGLPAMIEQISLNAGIRVARYLASCGSPTTLYADYAYIWNQIISNKFTDALIGNRYLLEYFAQKERYYS